MSESEKSSQSRSGGVGLTGLLFVLFVGLKLGKVIDWSWWWVTSPLWIPIAFILVVVCVCFLIALLAELIKRMLS